MISKSNRTRGIVAGAFVLAAIGAPFAVSAAAGGATDQLASKCRAHFGNIEDNICLDGDSGNSFTIGTPYYNGGNSPDSGLGTGPLVPGVTIDRAIG